MFLEILCGVQRQPRGGVGVAWDGGECVRGLGLAAGRLEEPTGDDEANSRASLGHEADTQNISAGRGKILVQSK